MFVVIYSPNSASALTVNDEFYADFADVLERTSTFAGCLITCEVKIHVDDTTSIQVSTSIALLDDFGLHDLIHQPTHSRGHQLDVFITRTDQPARSVIVDPPIIR